MSSPDLKFKNKSIKKLNWANTSKAVSSQTYRRMNIKDYKQFHILKENLFKYKEKSNSKSLSLCLCISNQFKQTKMMKKTMIKACHLRKPILTTTNRMRSHLRSMKKILSLLSMFGIRKLRGQKNETCVIATQKILININSKSLRE